MRRDWIDVIWPFEYYFYIYTDIEWMRSNFSTICHLQDSSSDKLWHNKVIELLVMNGKVNHFLLQPYYKSDGLQFYGKM